MARKALELRQFLEAENYVNKFNASSDEKTEEFFEIKFNLSLHLDSPSLNDDLNLYLHYLNVQKKYSKIIELVSNHLSKKILNHSFLYHYLVESLFMSGRQAEAASVARQHIEFLVIKKIYHKWQIEIERYQKFFKNYMFFKVMALQAYIATDDVINAEKKWHEIIEIIEKRYTKIEDIKEVEKKEIISRCHELVSQIEGSGINISILTHKALLVLKKYHASDLASSDWKKLVELIVYDASWFNLKLALELSLEREEEIFSETYKLMKKKKGFDLIKLTRFDKKLKEKLITKRLVNSDVEVIKLSESDLALGEVKSLKDEEVSLYEGKDEELYVVEKDLIKSLAFQEMDEKSILDLVTTFIQLEFYHVAKFLIKRSSEMKLTEINIRKIEYLKIIISTMLNDYHLALAELSEILGRNDILLDEYAELKYLEAAIYEKIGDNKNALRSYLEVKKINPEYRRLRERMQSFA